MQINAMFLSLNKNDSLFVIMGSLGRWCHAQRGSLQKCSDHGADDADDDDDDDDDDDFDDDDDDDDDDDFDDSDGDDSTLTTIIMHDVYVCWCRFFYQQSNKLFYLFYPNIMPYKYYL